MLGRFELSPDVERCIEECQNCHRVCLGMTMHHCLMVGGRHSEPRHLKLLLSCAAICQTSADLMLMGSTYHARMCALCADVCEACARSCEQVGDMEACVLACRRCAESCRKMTAPV